MTVNKISQKNNTYSVQEALKGAQKCSIQTPSINNSEDVVVIDGKEKKKLSKTSKILIGVGAFVATIGVAALFKGRITARKAAEEAKRIAEENKEKVRKEIQLQRERDRLAEEIRLAAEKAKKEKTERAEKLKLEKIEKEPTGVGIKLHSANLQKLTEEFDNRFDFNKMDKKNFREMIYQISTNDFADEMVMLIKKLEDNGASKNEIEQVVKHVIQTTNKVDETKFFSSNSSQGFHIPSYANTDAKHRILSRKNLLNDIEELKTQNFPKEDETISEYYKRLFDMRKTNVEKQKAEHLKTIETKISFTDEVPDMALTDKELEILQRVQPQKYANKTKSEALKILQEEQWNWREGYTDDMMITELPDEIESILLSKGFPRYASQKPVARWIGLNGRNFVPNDDVDKYVEETFQIGKKYIVPKLQSCSKNLHNSGDTYYHDWHIDWDTKFIIYPKGKISKAADIGFGKYGSGEVIYPKGTEFNVLDKRIEEIDSYGKKFFRWVITLQEA